MYLAYVVYCMDPRRLGSYIQQWSHTIAMQQGSHAAACTTACMLSILLVGATAAAVHLADCFSVLL